ncbi:MAG: glycosyltransferase [Candidatus Theseobacter exili]|nr:glycosyltransferase [Candidatus Theseobacter exili]
MKCSIIIPTFNKENYLAATLQSLSSQKYPVKELEVIIIDASPGVSSRKLHLEYSDKFKNLLWIDQSGGKLVSRAAARNLGLKAANGQLFLFIDDDMLLVPDFVNEHITMHLSNDAVVLGNVKQLYDSTVVNSSKTPVFKKEKTRDDYYIKAVRSMFEGAVTDCSVPWIGFTTNNVSIKRTHADKIGAFDESFTGWGYESIEYGYRAFLSGVKYTYNKKALAYHIEHSRNISDKICELNRNLSLFINKYEDSLSVKYYRDFVWGEISLERLNEIGKYGEDTLHKPDNGQTKYLFLKNWDKAYNKTD